MSDVKRRVTVVVNGKAFVVEFGDLAASPATVLVNGRAYQVELGQAEVATPAAAAAVPAAARAEPPAGPPAAGAGYVRAPMPGHVLDIAVHAGDQVSHGQVLCALEAMKMKSAIRAPRAGVVQSVEVTEGQAVAHGAPLFRLA